MASTFSNLKLELMATGENSGTWGDITNTNLGTALEEAITGSVDVAFSSADVTLTLTNTNASQPARNLRLNLTGTSGGARNLIVPDINKLYIVNNGLADTVTIKNATGTGVAVPSNKSMVVFNDGTNVVDVVTHLSSLTTSTLTAATSVTTASLTATTASISGGTVNNTTIGGTTPAAGTFSSLTATTASISGGTVNNTSIGATTPSTGAFTNFTASGTADFTSTGAVKIPAGTQAQRPTPVAGMLRFNEDSDEFEGYNGTAWSSVGGSAITNDTTTATDLFPAFLDATTGTAADIFTSDAKLLYKPSTGELKSEVLVAQNGIVVNAQVITENYTIESGFNASSAGPVSVDPGATVTVSAGSVWVVL